MPLSMRKVNLSRLLARRVGGIFLSDSEQGEIGPDLFRRACLTGLEGLVSKHRESPYQNWANCPTRALGDGCHRLRCRRSACRQIAPLPRGVFVKPTVLQPTDGGCRQPGSILAEQRRQSLLEDRWRCTSGKGSAAIPTLSSAPSDRKTLLARTRWFAGCAGRRSDLGNRRLAFADRKK